jgi:hypothetical protein
MLVEFCLEITSTWTWSEVELLLVDQHQVAVPLWRSPDMSPRPTQRMINDTRRLSYPRLNMQSCTLTQTMKPCRCILPSPIPAGYSASG